MKHGRLGRVFGTFCTKSTFGFRNIIRKISPCSRNDIFSDWIPGHAQGRKPKRARLLHTSQGQGRGNIKRKISTPLICRIRRGGMLAPQEYFFAIAQGVFGGMARIERCSHIATLEMIYLMTEIVSLHFARVIRNQKKFQKLKSK